MDKIVFIGYALFMFVGAYMGWKKGSNISMFAGLGSGLLMLLGIWLLTINPRGAYIFISCLTGVLSTVFLIRLLKTQAFMPSGMLLAVTVAVMIFTLLTLFKQNP
jgi:uncharacterized membrane protein (UPF0136 family)